mmetsp:Transcript_102007/g.227875  ORF Transcript_102007/g.227875 Transcript_102007/m.227875 type:complete len:157 (+) Transcript_102007:114-584(+)
MPCGILRIKLLRGRGFRSEPSKRWRVRVIVPETLYGMGEGKVWESAASDIGVASPEWTEDFEVFDIDWSGNGRQGRKAVQTNVEAEASELKQRVFQLLEAQRLQLEEQAKSLSALEEQVDVARQRREATAQAAKAPEKSPEKSPEKKGGLLRSMRP